MSLSDPSCHATPPPSLGRVLVVEDNTPMWHRLSRILRSCGVLESDMRHAPTLAQARGLLAQWPATLALVDIGLPDGNGADWIAQVQASHPQLPCVVVSAWGAPDTILGALRAGAVGYLLKEASDDEMGHSLRSIERGGAPIDPFVAKRILQLIASVAPTLPAAVQATSQPLSPRELEILGGVAQGLSNGEIADSLSLSRLTVESHTRNIYRKLAVGSRTAAVHQARQQGWLG